MIGNLKVSIITVCLNAQNTIEATIQSVLSQTYQDIEYIIIDGASTDRTLEIIEKYRKNLSKVVSERDEGIYDAMNKGLRVATGDVLYFLNSDDRLFSDSVIASVMKLFNEDHHWQLVYGDLVLENLPSKLMMDYLEPFSGSIENKFEFLRKGICQQRVFAKREVFNQIGAFDKNLKICADIKWFVQTFSYNIKMTHLPMNIAYFNSQGVSYREKVMLIREKLKIFLKHCSLGEFLHYLFYALWRNIHFILKR